MTRAVDLHTYVENTKEKSLVTWEYSEAERVLGTGDIYIYNYIHIYMFWHSATSL